MSVLTWVTAHPQVIWLVVTLVITALFKPRTAAEYEALPPRLAAVLKLVSALGIDPVKAIEASKQIISGTNK